MVVLLRCLPSSPPIKPYKNFRQSSGVVRSLAQQSQRKCHGKDQGCHSFLHFFPKRCKIPFSGNFICTRQVNHLTTSKKTCISDGTLSVFHDLMVKYFSDHQRMGQSLFRKVLVTTNSILFILPSNAFAETCEPDNSLFNMPLLFAIAMIGATVGGLLARQRRGELSRLNDQLRQINAALRRQAKIESYAPNLSYAPVGSRMAETEVVVDPRKEELISSLRTGKSYLRNQDPEKAFAEFKAALQLAQALGDHVEEKKAARGLGASLQRQGKYKDAIKYHKMVLDISKKSGDDSGATEAYGAIADCYTELGELEQAGKFYDKYIARLEND